MVAFVASLAGSRGRGLAPELSQDSLGRVPQGRKDIREVIAPFVEHFCSDSVVRFGYGVVADGLGWGLLEVKDYCSPVHQRFEPRGDIDGEGD
jgi:hypothetical protein